MESRASHEGPTMPMTPPVEKASIVEDFMDVFYAPAKVFARREKMGFGMQLFLVSLIAALFAFANRGVTSQIQEAEMSRRTAQAIAKDPAAAAQIEAAKPMMAKIMAVASFGAYLATPIVILALSLILWLIALIMRARVSVGQAALIVTIAFIPRQLGALATTLQVVLTDTSTLTNPFVLTASPARFLDREVMNAKLFAFLATLDAFRIWCAVIQGIGVSVLAKVPPSKGYLVAGVMFALFSVLLSAFA